MGMRIIGSSSSFDERNDNYNMESLPNPDPNNYKIIRYEEINSNLLIEIKYLDCTNYEGRKILLYYDCKYISLIKQREIDPHFSENDKFYSPIVRFEPTERGWEMGKIMARNL